MIMIALKLYKRVSSIQTAVIKVDLLCILWIAEEEEEEEEEEEAMHMCESFVFFVILPLVSVSLGHKG